MRAEPMVDSLTARRTWATFRPVGQCRMRAFSMGSMWEPRSLAARLLYANLLLVFRRNRPVRNRTPGGVGPGLALRG